MEMFLRLRVRSIPVWPFGVVSSNSSMRWRRSCQQKTVGLPSLVASARQSFRLLLTFCVVLRLVRRVFWFSAFNMARGCAAICVAWAFLRVQSSASVRHRTKAKISALGSRHAMWRAVCSWMNACELFELDLYVTMHGGVPCIFLRTMLASGSLPGDAAPTASPNWPRRRAYRLASGPHGGANNRSSGCSCFGHRAT